MTILVKKVFISSKPTFVYLLCPPLCGPFSIQESAAGGLSYKVKNQEDFLYKNFFLIFYFVIFLFLNHSSSFAALSLSKYNTALS